MKINSESCRRVLLICAGVIGCVGLVLTAGVIPSVMEEVTRGGTPQAAVVAFWVNIAFSFVSALAIFLIAYRSQGLSRLAKARLIVVGIVVLFLGFALADAASAYLGHGPGMQFASRVLIVCAVVDLLSGLVVIVTAAMCPLVPSPREPL